MKCILPSHSDVQGTSMLYETRYKDNRNASIMQKKDVPIHSSNALTGMYPCKSTLHSTLITSTLNMTPNKLLDDSIHPDLCWDWCSTCMIWLFLPKKTVALWNPPAIAGLLECIFSIQQIISKSEFIHAWLRKFLLLKDIYLPLLEDGMYPHLNCVSESSSLDYTTLLGI